MEIDGRKLATRNYDKKHGTGAYEEVNNPDSEHYGRDADELQAEWDAEISKGKDDSPYSRAKAARDAICATPQPEPAPEPNPWDDRPEAQQAVDAFLEKNPEYTSPSAWKTLSKTARESQHPDIYILRKKFEGSESMADAEALLARAAEIAPGEKTDRDRRAAFEQIAKQRMANRGM